MGIAWTLMIQRFCRECDRSRPASVSPGELDQPLFEKTDFRRIVNPAALEQADDHRACRLELVHVLQDENLHLLSPRWHVRVGGVALDRLSVAQGKRQIMKAMLREKRTVREPGPTPVRVVEESAVHILENLPAAGGIGILRIDSGRGKQRVVAPWIERKDGVEPSDQAAVVELLVRDAIVGAVVEGLQVQHREARGGRFFSKA